MRCCGSMLGRNLQKMQRAIGPSEGQLAAKGLSSLYRSGCAKALLSNTYGQTAEAVIINTSDGMTGAPDLPLAANAELMPRCGSPHQWPERG